MCIHVCELVCVCVCVYTRVCVHTSVCVCVPDVGVLFWLLLLTVLAVNVPGPADTYTDRHIHRQTQIDRHTDTQYVRCTNKHATHTYTHVHIHIHIYACMFVSISIYYMHVCLCVECVCVVCVCVCVCVCVYHNVSNMRT